MKDDLLVFIYCLVRDIYLIRVIVLDDRFFE